MTANRAALLLISAHILSMLGFSTYPALLTELRDLWRLSNAEAGVIGSMFFVGYMATVSYWTALTDRIDGRRVYLAGSCIALAGCAGFGLAAQGFASACAFQVMMGVGIAGTYMPGLHLLSGHISGPSQSRYISFYTSFFGIGTALSFALAGIIAPLAGWRGAFVLCAAGSVVSGLLVSWGITTVRRERAPDEAFSLATLFPLGAWRKVLANRAATGFIVGYCVHCMELFGSRGWIVAFLAFSASLSPGESFPWNAAAIAALVNLCAVPASILGNEVALRVGRRRWILIVMTASSLAGIALGLSAPLHWAIVLALLIGYSMLVMAESGTLTAGLVAAAPQELRGAAMGLYSLIGFGGGMLGPAVFGMALDATGGEASLAAWTWGYVAIGAGCLAAAPIVRLATR
jgi:MFS family permease